MVYKIANWTTKGAFRLIVTAIIIILISNLPSIFKLEPNAKERRIEVKIVTDNYLPSVSAYFKQLLQGNLGKYPLSYNPRTKTIKERKVAADIFRFYKNSTIVFLSAIFSGVFVGLIGGLIAIWVKQKWRSFIEFLSFFLVAIPDFFLILVFQILVIYIYKKTGIKTFAIASAGGRDAYFLPILTLSLMPIAYVFRTALHSFEEIQAERYILTAYSKGLSKLKIIWSHILKNGLITVLNNMPSILMLTLSNLFILEYMYNTYGITSFIYSNRQSAEVLSASVLLIWLLVEAILLINSWIISTINRQKGRVVRG